MHTKQHQQGTDQQVSAAVRGRLYWLEIGTVGYGQHLLFDRQVLPFFPKGDWKQDEDIRIDRRHIAMTASDYGEVGHPATQGPHEGQQLPIPSTQLVRVWSDALGFSGDPGLVTSEKCSMRNVEAWVAVVKATGQRELQKDSSEDYAAKVLPTWWLRTHETDPERLLTMQAKQMWDLASESLIWVVPAGAALIAAVSALKVPQTWASEARLRLRAAYGTACPELYIGSQTVQRKRCLPDELEVDAFLTQCHTDAELLQLMETGEWTIQTFHLARREDPAEYDDIINASAKSVWSRFVRGVVKDEPPPVTVVEDVMEEPAVADTTSEPVAEQTTVQGSGRY